MEGMKICVKMVKKEGFYLRMKINDLRDRISIPEIHLEWREAVESVLLIILSLFLYISVIFTQFSFVPIMIVTIKRGWKESALYITGASAILIYIMVNSVGRFPFDSTLLLFSPIHYCFQFLGSNLGIKGARFLDYYFLFGVLGVFLGYLVSRNYKLGYVIFSSLCAYVGVVVFILGLSGFIGGFKTYVSAYSHFVDNKISSYITLYLAQVDNYRSILIAKEIDYNLVERKLEAAVEIYKKGVIFGIAPKGGYLIKQIILIFLSILFVKFYFKRKLEKAALNFNIKNYTMNDDWVWALIGSWALVYLNLYINNNLLGIICWNSAVIVSFLFFLRGLAIIKIVADRLKIPKFLQYAVLLFLFFYFFLFFVIIATGIGTADIWLKIQENMDKTRNKRRDA